MRTRRTLALGLLALVLVGCGAPADDDGGGVATAGGEPTGSASDGPGPSDRKGQQEQMLRFARCMRENGLPTFPDPDFEGGSIHLAPPEGANPATVRAAQQECRQHLPNGGEPVRVDPAVSAQLREYAKCMRANGVPKFPDPNENGGISLDGGPDLDPRSEVFRAAERACVGHRPAPPGGDTDGPSR